MCNSIHLISKPIKKEGKGWKIFSQDDQPCFGYGEYSRKKDGPVVWKKDSAGDGFCFLLRKREAERLLRDIRKKDEDYYQHHHIHQIQYAGGLVRQTEDNITDPDVKYKCALCGEFRIID